jgi:hypothetical protein
MSKRRRELPSETKVEVVKAVLQGGGFLVLFFGAVGLLKGLYSGAIRPAEIIARRDYYRDVVVHALEASLLAVIGVAVFVGLVVLLLRHGRAWMGSWITVWWRYRRRWASVVKAHGLTGTERKRVVVPRLHTVAAGLDCDVLTVAMLPGQSPDEWDQASAELAAAFGLHSGRLKATGANGAIDLEFARSRPNGRRTVLVPAGQVPALVEGRKPELVALVRAWSLQFSWARIRVRGHDENNYRPRLLGRVRWNTMTSYYVLGGL